MRTNSHSENFYKKNLFVKNKSLPLLPKKLQLAIYDTKRI